MRRSSSSCNVFDVPLGQIKVKLCARLQSYIDIEWYPVTDGPSKKDHLQDRVTCGLTKVDLNSKAEVEEASLIEMASINKYDFIEWEVWSSVIASQNRHHDSGPLEWRGPEPLG
jgi:hypothetical protein